MSCSSLLQHFLRLNGTKIASWYVNYSISMININVIEANPSSRDEKCLFKKSSKKLSMKLKRGIFFVKVDHFAMLLKINIFYLRANC